MNERIKEIFIDIFFGFCMLLLLAFLTTIVYGVFKATIGACN